MPAPLEIAHRLHARLRRENGQTMSEYALILSIIIIAAVAAVTLLSGAIQNGINAVVPLI